MFSKEFFISANDVNAESELQLPLLVAAIIEIATNHANQLGVGNPAMESIGCGWVLSRLTIEMTAYPKVNETYTLHTWVEGWNRHFSTRCFRVDDCNGNIIGYARSIWMVMNTGTHENAGLGHLHLNTDEITPQEKCPISRQAKHISLEPSAEDRRYRFQYCDIDFYRHVNTVRYVVLLLNGFSLQTMDRNMVSRLELSFLHEGHYGSEIVIRKKEEQSSDGVCTSFMLYDTEAEREILYSRVNLVPREQVAT